MGLGGLVLVLLMLLGLCMRLSQGGSLSMEPALFYQVMTAHGAGMVGTAALTGAAIMWFFLARHVQLIGWVYWLMLILFLLGVVLILGAIFFGRVRWCLDVPVPASCALRRRLGARRRRGLPRRPDFDRGRLPSLLSGDRPGDHRALWQPQPSARLAAPVPRLPGRRAAADGRGERGRHRFQRHRHRRRRGGAGDQPYQPLCARLSPSTRCSPRT